MSNAQAFLQSAWLGDAVSVKKYLVSFFTKCTLGFRELVLFDTFIHCPLSSIAPSPPPPSLSLSHTHTLSLSFSLSPSPPPPPLSLVITT